MKPLTGALGAEVGGLDLGADRSATSNAPSFTTPSLAHCAIYIRDQQLGGEDLLPPRSAILPSPPTIRSSRRMPDFPQIFRTAQGTSDQKENVGGAWHSDTTYLDKPPIGTMLYAREVPAYGGDTAWWRTSTSPTRPCRWECSAC